MARRKTRTRRKSRRGRRRTRRRTQRRRRRRQKGGAGTAADNLNDNGPNPSEQGFAVAGSPQQQGGKRRRNAQKGRKRKMNAFFKQMLAAKKAGKASFIYTKKGGKPTKYVGKKHARLGMIYKKA